MAKYLRQSTASQEILLGQFVDSTDGNTAETGLTIANTDILLHKHGGTTLPTKNSGGATHISAGYYYAVLDATDTDTLGNLVVACHPTGALAFRDSYCVLPANVFDSLVLGTDLLDISVVQNAGSAITQSGGRQEVNVSHFGGTAGTFASGIPSASLTTSAINAVADQVCDEDLTGHRAANSLGARLQHLHSGACQAGGSGTTVVLASGASSVDDYYNGDLVMGWVTADGTNKFADYISDYTGSTRTATVTGIPVSPDATYTYVVIPGGTIPGASAPSADDNAAAVWNKATASHASAGTFGEALGIGTVVRRGTAQGGASGSITLDASASATNDIYKYQRCDILSGTGAGQSRQITGYTGSSKVATVDPAWTTAPSSDSVFIIAPLGIDAVTLALVADAIWDEARSGHNTAGTFGEYVFADVLRLSGDATAADNAESFFDGTGYAGTNNVIPQVTTVTGNVNGSVGSLVGHTVQTGDAFARLGAPAGASVSADIAAVKSDSAAILVDTNELQTDITNGGRVDTLIDGIKAKTDSLTFTAAGVVDANVERVNAQDIGASKPYNTAT